MDIPDELTQVKEGTRRAAHLAEALGGILLVALLAWLVFSYLNKSSGENINGGEVTPNPPTKEEMIKQMSEKASTTVVVSAVEKEKMFDQMSQLAPTTVRASGTSKQQAAPAPVVSPAEKQKMIDAMQQKAP